MGGRGDGETKRRKDGQMKKDSDAASPYCFVPLFLYLPVPPSPPPPLSPSPPPPSSPGLPVPQSRRLPVSGMGSAAKGTYCNAPSLTISNRFLVNRSATGPNTTCASAAAAWG